MGDRLPFIVPLLDRCMLNAFVVEVVLLGNFLLQLGAEEIQLRGLKWSKLLDPDKKGQWWLSGDCRPIEHSVTEIAEKIDSEALEAQKLLQLASAQRMNTEARRAIFCVIMSGEDYMDAFEKILRLDLPGRQVCLSVCLSFLFSVFTGFYVVKFKHSFIQI